MCFPGPCSSKVPPAALSRCSPCLVCFYVQVRQQRGVTADASPPICSCSTPESAQGYVVGWPGVGARRERSSWRAAWTTRAASRRAVNELQLTDEFVHPPDRVLRCPGRCVLRRGGVTALDRARDEGELEPMAMDELCRRAVAQKLTLGGARALRRPWKAQQASSTGQQRRPAWARRRATTDARARAQEPGPSPRAPRSIRAQLGCQASRNVKSS